MRRGLSWILTLPVVAAGVLLGHALAYRITGAPLGPTHDYLEHGPQLVLVLLLVGAVGAAVQQRSVGQGSVVPYALVAGTAFACQEHLERVAHGHPTLLAADPTFLVGLALQAPVVLACILVARWVGRAAAAGAPSRPPLVSGLRFTIPAIPVHVPEPTRAPPRRGRDPPRFDW